MLEYPNTPIDNVASPAQILMSRQLLSLLATTKSKIQLKIVDPEIMKQNLEAKQRKQKLYFDRGSTKRMPLQKGESVLVQVKNK